MTKFVCVECGFPTGFIFKDMNASPTHATTPSEPPPGSKQQKSCGPVKTDGIRLERCANCGNSVDKYAEYDPVIVHLDALLQRPQAYAHIIWNDLLQPGSSKHLVSALLSILFCSLTPALGLGAFAAGVGFITVFLCALRSFEEAVLVECLCFRVIVPISFLNAVWAPCVPLTVFTLLVFVATNISCLLTLKRATRRRLGTNK